MSPICSPPASPSTYQRIPLSYGYGKARSGLEQQHGGRIKMAMHIVFKYIFFFSLMRSIQLLNCSDNQPNDFKIQLDSCFEKLFDQYILTVQSCLPVHFLLN